jgi:hypothetical protein
VSVSDTSIAGAGVAGIRAYVGSPSGWNLDHFALGSLDSGGPTATASATPSMTNSPTPAAPTSTATSTPTATITTP